MTMTNSQKAQRSHTIKAVALAAESVGITVVDQFDFGGRALVGKQGFDTLVWLESDGRWHRLAD